MAKITSLPDGVEFDANAGETLLEAALRAELPLTHACGGRAKCSPTCRVWGRRPWGSTGALRAPTPSGRWPNGSVSATRYASPANCDPGGDLRVRRLVIDETDLMMTSQLDRSTGDPRRRGPRRGSVLQRHRRLHDDG